MGRQGLRAVGSVVLERRVQHDGQNQSSWSLPSSKRRVRAQPFFCANNVTEPSPSVSVRPHWLQE